MAKDFGDNVLPLRDDGDDYAKLSCYSAQASLTWNNLLMLIESMTFNVRWEVGLSGRQGGAKLATE